MDRIVDSDYCTFHCKKWTLFSFCLIGIISNILTTIIILSVHDLDEAQISKGAVAWVVTICTFSASFSLLGILGAYREHYGLAMTYAILMFLLTLTSIGGAFANKAFWFGFAIRALITIMAFLYANDLHKWRYRSSQSLLTAQTPSPFADPYGYGATAAPLAGSQPGFTEA